jgi:predicted PurR-regulated permease PerM
VVVAIVVGFSILSDISKDDIFIVFYFYLGVPLAQWLCQLRSGRAASGFAIASVILVALLFIVIIVSKCFVLPSFYLSLSQWPQGSTGFAALRIPHANFSQKLKVKS